MILHIFFNAFKNNLTKPYEIKNKLINGAINPTGADASDINDKNVTIPLASDKKSKPIPRNSRILAHLLIYLVFFYLS